MWWRELSRRASKYNYLAGETYDHLLSNNLSETS